MSVRRKIGIRYRRALRWRDTRHHKRNPVVAVATTHAQMGDVLKGDTYNLIAAENFVPGVAIVIDRKTGMARWYRPRKKHQ